MRNTKTLSISLPPSQRRAMEQTARKENQTMSELVRELYGRYSGDRARREFARALEDLRAEAAGSPASRLNMRELDAEIAASRRAHKRKAAAR
jgi:Arc/MetJ-type ribon-helix-helix transcriptional regulator